MRKIVLIETQIISSGNFVNYFFIEFSSLCYSSNIEKQIFTPLQYKRNDNVSISNFIPHRNFTREPNASVLVDDIRILMRYSVADGWQAAYVRDNSINLGQSAPGNTIRGPCTLYTARLLRIGPSSCRIIVHIAVEGSFTRSLNNQAFPLSPRYPSIRFALLWR